MKSMREACKELKISLGTLQRTCKRLNIDTSKGISEESLSKLKKELGVEAETVEIVYIEEPQSRFSIAKFQPSALTKAPVITDDEVEAIELVVEQYQNQLAQQQKALDDEQKAVAQRNQRLQIAAEKLKAAKLRKEIADIRREALDSTSETEGFFNSVVEELDQ